MPNPVRRTDGSQCGSLVELLQLRASEPDQRFCTFLADGETDERFLTYADLDRRARVIAARLQELRATGERVLLLYPAGTEYLEAFFGCLYAGAIAVPVYPPRLNQNMERLEAIVADAGATIALTTTAILAVVERRFAEHPRLRSLRWLNSEEIQGIGTVWQDPKATADTLAFLQYTSGSTGTPKGVMVSHGNLLHNSGIIQRAFNLTRDDVVVSWLPLYHDMGLIGCVLQPLYTGIPLILMPPASFLQRPVRWLKAISRYRATVSGAPNFAYELCVRKISPDEQDQLDLRSWQVAFSGAEPIRAETLNRFSAAFSGCGFRATAFYPCYGLAEATLMVSGAVRERGAVTGAFDPEALEQNWARSVPAEADSQFAARRLQTLVSCGVPQPDQQVLIVNPETRVPCPQGEIGEVWVQGPSVTRGYWNRPEATTETFGACLRSGEGPFLRTGDLGFLHDGQLYITGRSKDLIIIRGRNHYPQDIEFTAQEAHPAVRAEGVAAFTVDQDGEEQLVLVMEVHRHHKDLEAVVRAVRQAVAEEHGLQVWAVVLIRERSLPRTSSGKIRRSACRADYLAGTLRVVHLWQAGRSGEASGEGPAGTLAPETIPARGGGPAATVGGEIPAGGTRGTQSGGENRSTQEIQNWLVAELARRLGLTPEQIDVDQPFTAFGLDSLQAVNLVGSLESWLGRSLSPTLVWDYPTITALSRYLSGEEGPGAARFGRRESQSAPTRPLDEGIAIVGMGCRFPGAGNPAAFWELLRSGVEAVQPIPAERRQGLRVAGNRAGLLSGIDQFDPLFFGISPREAARMDPQQRLVLEVAWEALEHGGIAPDRLAGSLTGVFVGISAGDYGHLQMADRSRLDAYVGTGSAHSVAANRISYLLDLRGPSVAVDTACSSSLVAVHMACQSLLTGECDLALAGGVNVLLLPELSAVFSQANMLSPEGRCKTFAANADGYVRAEGCGVVVLKRLSDALADGDRILAVIRGSAVNHNGRTNGLTAPSGLAQQEVIRRALHQAGVTAADLDYIEAHGTGTPLGDPIEFQALRAVMDEAPAETPRFVGSVKTNLGHLEAAAGIAGLIKVVLALLHGAIPPHLHLQSLNPHLDGTGTRLQIPTQRIPWPDRHRPRRAGVSSFGFGGTNAHVVVEEAPALSRKQRPAERPVHLLTLSARNEEALHQAAERYADYLAASPQLAPGDVCFTSNTGRTHFEHRLALPVTSNAELTAGLRAFATGQAVSGALVGHVRPGRRPRVAFLFTGQGAQYVNMARRLYETQPTFRAAVNRCTRLFDPHLDRPLLSVLYPPEAGVPADSTDSADSGPDVLLHRTAYTQPALFAVEYALAELWRSWGIEPDAVLGHSLGEYVAACVAGALELEDAVRLVAARARLMQALPEAGAMVAVFADEARVSEWLQPYRNRISIAALNAPGQTVVAGAADAVQTFCQELGARGVESRPLQVSHAFHSPLMEPMLDEFTALARGIRAGVPRIPLISNVTGRPLEPGQTLDAAYWREHIRRPVRFADGIQTLDAMGCNLYLETGPHPVLIQMGRRTVPAGGSTWLCSLQRGRDDWQVLLQSLATLYVQGAPIDWQGFDRDYGYGRVELPTYPFQRQRYWFTDAGVQPGETQPLWSDGSAPLAAVDGQPPDVPPAGGAGSGGATSGAAPSHQAASDLAEQVRAIRNAPPDRRAELLRDLLREQVAQVLQLEPEQVDVQHPLNMMGLDSLMAVELRNRLAGALGVNMPLVQFLEGPTIAQVAEQVAAELARGQELQAVAAATAQQAATAELPETRAGVDGRRAAELLQNLDALSETELDQLLRDLLQGGKDQNGQDA